MWWTVQQGSLGSALKYIDMRSHFRLLMQMCSKCACASDGWGCGGSKYTWYVPVLYVRLVSHSARYRIQVMVQQNWQEGKEVQWQVRRR